MNSYLATIKFIHCTAPYEFEIKEDFIDAVNMKEAIEKLELIWYRNVEIIKIVKCQNI